MSDSLLNQGDTAGTVTPPASGEPNGSSSSATATTLDYSSLIKPDGSITDPSKFFSGDAAHLAKRFSSVAALSNSYVNLEKTLSGGKGRVVVPDDASPDEVKEAFYKAIGRPDKPEDYGFKKPETVRDEVWDEAGAKEFATLAHQLGLSKTQASKLAEWELTRGSKAVEITEQQAAQAKEKAVADLKKDWPGELFTQNLRVAKQAAIQFGSPDILQDDALANNPTFVRIMSKVGTLMGEGGTAGARQSGASLGINPQDEINKIMGDKTDPYWQANHPQHASRVEHVAKLYAMKRA